jgi:hypothetical protein
MKFRLTAICVLGVMAQGTCFGGLGLDGLFSSGCSDAACGETTVCGETLQCIEEGCNSGCGLGFLKQSDHCFDDFVSPMTNPVYFEDPRTLTEARFIFLNHRVPNSLGGDNVQLYALQLRAALTERLSFIATKDGFIVSQNPLVDDGFADVAAGLKYNLLRDPQTQTIWSVGATYELPAGSRRALQGNGDGEFHLFTTAGMEILDGMHWITASGFRLPANRAVENQSYYWSNHLDKEIGDSGIYLVGETTWWRWLSETDAFPVGVEGLDLFNLGSVNVKNNNIVTGAVGLKVKPSGNTEVGIAWETFLTDRRDILQNRLTVDWILRY